MKSYAIVAAALLFTSTSALANGYKFVNADGSELSNLCIAAVESSATIDTLAADMGLAPVSAQEVSCNGRPILFFAHKYRAMQATAPRISYVVSRANEAPETQLCLAALTSETEYAKVKAAHFSDIKDVEQNIKCNNLPLNRFVRKYRDRLASSQPTNTASL